MKNKTLHLNLDKLLTHPKNLRRFYAEKDVKEMSDSIRATGGVLQALRVVSDGNGKFLVVDGNMRLAGGQKLGKDCPQLKCEVVTDTQAEQFLAMIITSKFRYKPDPVSEALHYQRLIDDEGYNVHRIVKATGLNHAYIKTRLMLLELDDEIQEHVAMKRLPKIKEAVEALLSIKDVEVRVKLANRLAASRASTKVVVSSCRRINESLAQTTEKATTAMSSAREAKPKTKRTWSQVREALFGMCETCDMRLASSVEEPAWTFISHAAKDTCERCSIKEINAACLQCPGVEIVQRLVKMSKAVK